MGVGVGLIAKVITAVGVTVGVINVLGVMVEVTSATGVTVGEENTRGVAVGVTLAPVGVGVGVPGTVEVAVGRIDTVA